MKKTHFKTASPAHIKMITTLVLQTSVSVMYLLAAAYGPSRPSDSFMIIFNVFDWYRIGKQHPVVLKNVMISKVVCPTNGISVELFPCIFSMLSFRSSEIAFRMVSATRSSWYVCLQIKDYIWYGNISAPNFTQFLNSVVYIWQTNLHKSLYRGYL